MGDQKDNQQNNNLQQNIIGPEQNIEVTQHNNNLHNFSQINSQSTNNQRKYIIGRFLTKAVVVLFVLLIGVDFYLHFQENLAIEIGHEEAFVNQVLPANDQDDGVFSSIAPWNKQDLIAKKRIQHQKLKKKKQKQQKIQKAQQVIKRNHIDLSKLLSQMLEKAKFYGIDTIMNNISKQGLITFHEPMFKINNKSSVIQFPNYFTQKTKEEQQSSQNDQSGSIDPHIIKQLKSHSHQDIQRHPHLHMHIPDNQLELIMNKMMYPSYRDESVPQFVQLKNKYSQQIINLAYFFYQLSKQPSNQAYFEAQFYHFDRKYSISKFKTQLPICVVLTSHNNENSIQQAYKSLSRQNYSNFHIVHMDDNSEDLTIAKTIQFYQQNSFISQRSTLLWQKSRKNQLWNRHFANSKYCHDKEIIVELKADDYLIGRQVLQVVNTLYQTGVFKYGKREQLWALYTNNIGCIQMFCPVPSFAKEIPVEVWKDQTYRNGQYWRTNNLRTYLKQIYTKIDPKDFKDKLMFNKEQFYVDGYHQLVHSSIFQLAGQKHILFINQFPYFNNMKTTSMKSVQLTYSKIVMSTLPSYQPLVKLQDLAVKNKNQNANVENMQKLKKIKEQVKKIREELKKNITKLYGQNLGGLKEASVAQLYLNNIQNRQVNKVQKNNSELGNIPELTVSLNGLKTVKNIKQNTGLVKSIQVGSDYDYLKLGQKLNFSQIKQKLFEQASHELLTFNKDSSLQLNKTKIKVQSFVTDLQIQRYLNVSTYKQPNGKFNNDTEYFLGAILALQNIPTKTKQLQYYYYNKKYSIGENRQQAPICIFAIGYQVYSTNQYKRFLHSIQRLNYTNFQIVYVDDNSTDNSAYEIYKYLKQNNMRIKNKIKIVKNLIPMGVLASTHIYVSKYCGPTDIVVITEADDSFIGTQTLQILNSIYKDSNKWLVYSRYLYMMDKDHPHQFYPGPSLKSQQIQVNKYRMSFQINATAHLRTFRKQLMDKVPLQHFIQYTLSEDKKSAWPHYYNSLAHKFQIYTLLQLCGNEHATFISDFLYNHNQDAKGACQKNEEMINQYKSRMKIPLEILQSLQSTPKFSTKSLATDQFVYNIKQFQQLKSHCK